jgi:para-nitrobenzyl esterase
MNASLNALRAPTARRLGTVVAVATLAAAGLFPAAAADNPDTRERAASPGTAIVRTSDGALRGMVEHGHREFLGVPYAAPLSRWERPTDVEPWDGVRDATEPGAECVQQATFWRPTSPASTTEDCLFLNVYTPREGKRDATRPVIVYFHGGGSVNGSSTDARPTRMAAWGDAVVVSANYRLGLMGDLYLPELDAESPDGQSGGNWSTHDAAQALRWVEENIDTFGGDPENVTVAGQSAGGGLVCRLLASTETDGLFDRAVIESAGSCGSGATKEQAAELGAELADHLGCTEVATRLDCLRSKPASDILSAQIDVGRAGPVYGGSDLPLDPPAAFASGEFQQVPIIYGSTRNEDRAFVYEQHDLVRQPLPGAEYEDEVRAEYGEDADAVLAAYPLADHDTPGTAWAQVQSDDRFCSAQSVPTALAGHVPTYAYEFQDETSPARPYMTVPPSFPIGSGHSSELPYLWQNDTEPLDRTQLRLSRLMIGYWSQFAATGDPNGKRLPEWPDFTQEETRLALQEGGATRALTGADLRAQHSCDVWEALD